ncbi:hypothetical protein HYV71_02295 [Candidatus Uhrbacteria bacterium]|nr:hypothetical protein [Candidatus Uhrbacteria bacterium]
MFGIRADTAAARDSESMIAATECGLSIIPPDNNHSDPYFREIPDLLVDAFLPIPSENRRVSAVCEFALGSKVPYNDNHAARVTFSYAESDYRVRVYYWRKTKKEWKALPTEMNRLSRTAIANVPFDAAIVTVLANESPSHEGIVSWYRHKRYPSGSATNLYPTGTHLTVTNLDNGKSVDVTVTSTWTNTDDRRILDLVSTAFRKIADTRIGLINARIEWKGYENPFDEK